MAFGPHEVEWGCGVGKVVRNVEAKWLRRIALASVFGVFLDLFFFAGELVLPRLDCALVIR